MAEQLADDGKDPYATIVKGTLDLGQTAAGLYEKNADLLAEGGLDSAEAIEKCFLNNFVGLGFATVNGDVLRFRPPVNRFLDVCLELGTARSGEESESPAEVSDGN